MFFFEIWNLLRFSFHSFIQFLRQQEAVNNAQQDRRKNAEKNARKRASYETVPFLVLPGHNRQRLDYLLHKRLRQVRVQNLVDLDHKGDGQGVLNQFERATFSERQNEPAAEETQK